MLLQRRPRGMFSYLLLIFLVLALGIGFVGNTYYDHERDRIKRATHDDLSAIADLKVNQIERWRNERLRDADVIMGTTRMAETVDQWLKGPASQELEQTILTWMKAHSSSLDYRTEFPESSSFCEVGLLEQQLSRETNVDRNSPIVSFPQNPSLNPKL